jgi:ubiquinol-cytochrome c reductase cytochrome c1 subunit
MMKKILACLIAAAPLLAWAEEGGLALDRAPINLNDKVSLQRGAAAFANHCLNCHSAASMRFARLEELGLTEAEIRDNLIFTEAKVGDTMAAAIDPKVAKAAFGVVPPDLSLAARSRSPDWLYTYLRGFYRDPGTKSGWNNTAFRNVAMPHVLWEYQGAQVLQVEEKMDTHTGDVKVSSRLVLEQPGRMSRLEYDQFVADLVNYLAYMSEPAQSSRRHWGILVLFFLAGFFVLTLLLKQEYWKDVR